MSKYLKITASNYTPEDTTMNTTVTRTLRNKDSNSPPLSDSFAGQIPSEYFPEGWSVFGNLSVYLYSSTGFLTSGDAFIYITDMAGSRECIHKFGETSSSSYKLLPRKGNTYNYPIHPWTENARGDFTNIQIQFKSDLLTYTVKMQNLSIEYAAVPYKLKIDTQGPGYVKYSHRSENETAISVKAIPYNSNCKFIGWSDGVTTEERIIDPGTNEADIYLIAYFEIKTYTVNYYDYSSGQSKLVQSLECQCGKTYYHCDLPIIQNLPAGYASLSSWVKNSPDIYSEQDGAIKLKTGSSATLVEPGKEFSDLTTTDGQVINYYFNLCPYKYSITYYRIYSTGTIQSYKTMYHIHGEEEEITLIALPAPASGYKTNNQINIETGKIDNSIANRWYLNTTEVEPGSPFKEKLTKNELIQNFSFYSKESPIDYYIYYYNEDQEIYIQHCEYGEQNSYIDLPITEVNPKEGHKYNTLGWVKEKGSIPLDQSTVYNLNDLNVEIPQYSGTFSNLTTKDNEIIKLYYYQHPIIYNIDYIKYEYNKENAVVLETDKRIYGIDYNIKNLPLPKDGYKLTNQMTEEYGFADNSIVNSWFIDENNMKPTDNKITLIDPYLADNITLYSYEVPINCYINYCILDHNKQEINKHTIIGEYGQSYVCDKTFENKTGYELIGWYNNNNNDISNWYKNFNTNFMNGISPNLSLYNEYLIDNSIKDGQQIFLYAYYIPYAYNVVYTKYILGNTSEYSTSTAIRVFGKEYTTENLPVATTGYKLTNKMEELNGAENPLIFNSWFISNEHMKPNDNKISVIDPNLAENITLYSYETPNNFYLNYYILDSNKQKIDECNIIGEQGKRYVYPKSFTSINGYKLLGWFDEDKNNIDNIFIYSTTDAINEDGFNPSLNLNAMYSPVASLKDQSVINLYAYYIPYAYYIKYTWLDSFQLNNPDYQLPDMVWRIYGKEDYLIETIPSYEEYTVDNANTKNWYYYDEDETLQINQQEYILSIDQNNYDFYGRKRGEKRKITFDSSNLNFGNVEIVNKTEDDLYHEGDIIQTYVHPTEIAYFYGWSDGNNDTTRTFTVGNRDAHYTAIFRSNQIYINTLGVLNIYKNTTPVKTFSMPRKIFPFTYKVINEDTYGFYLNNDNFYESNNKKVHSSYAKCRVIFESKIAKTIYIDCINSGEGSWDFGMISKINTSLSNSNTSDSNTKIHHSFSNSHSSASIQTVALSIPKGISFIEIKYIKDVSVHSGNDSLQFKIRSV